MDRAFICFFMVSSLKFKPYPFFSACTADCGIFSNIWMRALAGPVGCLRCCSQFCKVRTLTRIIDASSFCDRFALSRMPFTSTDSTWKTRFGFASPLEIATASLTLSTSSENIWSSILHLLQQCAQNPLLIYRQVNLAIFGIDRHEKNHEIGILPVVDHP